MLAMDSKETHMALHSFEIPARDVEQTFAEVDSWFRGSSVRLVGSDPAVRAGSFREMLAVLRRRTGLDDARVGYSRLGDSSRHWIWLDGNDFEICLEPGAKLAAETPQVCEGERSFNTATNGDIHPAEPVFMRVLRLLFNT